MEPFKGLKQAQVTRAVADKGKRPEIPEEASASPDVVPLMEQCWKQDPADRPDGFEPVVQALASVVARVGDPRFTPSPGAKRGGRAPTVGCGGSVDAPSRWADPKSHFAGDDSGSAFDERNEPPSAMFGSGRDVGALEGTVSWSAVKEKDQDADRVSAPYADLPIVSKGVPPSNGAGSDRFKEPTKRLGQQLSTTVRSRNRVRFRHALWYSDLLAIPTF